MLEIDLCTRLKSKSWLCHVARTRHAKLGSSLNGELCPALPFKIKVASRCWRAAVQGALKVPQLPKSSETCLTPVCDKIIEYSVKCERN